MPTFVWEGRTRAGDLRKGVMEAENDAALMNTLRQQDIAVTKVKRKAKELNLQLGTGVGTRDIVIFTRQFATMIDAGLPLVQALDILASQADNKTFGKILFEVKGRVEGGATFSDALKGHPKVFDDLFVNLVAAGEVAGILDTIMNRLATHIEKEEKLKAKIKSALVYPTIVALVSVAVITILLWKVIPVFEKMFSDMGSASMPALTQFLIDVSRGFAGNVHWIGLGVVIISVSFSATQRTYKGKRTFHAILLKIPLIGNVLRKGAVARFTRTFGTLLSSGVPILDAMDIVAKTAGNLIIQEAVLEVREKVSEGKEVAGPLMQTGVFPPMVVQMIGVGEQTGAMDQMLQKIADFYEDEVDTAVEALTSALEPMMMVVLGGVVGTIMIGMYMPIFGMAGAVGTH